MKKNNLAIIVFIITSILSIKSFGQNSFQYGDKVPIYLSIELGELEYAQVFTLTDGGSGWEKLIFTLDGEVDNQPAFNIYYTYYTRENLRPLKLTILAKRKIGNVWSYKVKIPNNKNTYYIQYTNINHTCIKMEKIERTFPLYNNIFCEIKN